MKENIKILRDYVVGGHTTLENIKIEKLIYTAKNGVRKAEITVYNPKINEWISKSNKNPIIRTLFPEWWTANRIKVEVNEAYLNKIIHPYIKNKWFGITPSGIKVEGFLEPNITVYPKLD